VWFVPLDLVEVAVSVIGYADVSFVRV